MYTVGCSIFRSKKMQTTSFWHTDSTQKPLLRQIKMILLRFEGSKLQWLLVNLSYQGNIDPLEFQIIIFKLHLRSFSVHSNI